jgi:DNA polymerase III delta subunit
VRRPTKQQIATRLVQVARSEGMALEQNAAEMLVEQVRAVL